MSRLSGDMAQAEGARGVHRRIFPKLLVLPFFLATLLFLPAGRLDLFAHWTYFSLLLLFAVVNSILLARADPGLLEERMRTGPGDRTPYFRLMIGSVFIAHFGIAGLDAGRYHWSGEFPGVLQGIGLAGLAVSLAGWSWAMWNNRFFSGQVRIQRERGHCVESGGPYRFVRHPGYAAMFVLLAASPLALGSYWSALVLAPGLPLLFYRTTIEDHMLLAELEGYPKYAARVPWRLVPGIW